MVFECFVPGLPQICRNAGAEFVLYDMEHTGLGFETLKTQLALCRGLGIVPMARVPRGEYHFIARALDVGAFGVMVPMVATGAEAEHLVSCSRYPPHGRRGAAFGFAHDDYQGGDIVAKMAALHQRTMMIAQIETAEGLDNVEAIAAVPGIDALWIGQFDLTNFLGIPGAISPSGVSRRGRPGARCLRDARQGSGDARHRRCLGARLRRQGVSPDGLRHRPAAAAGSAAARTRRAA